MLGEPTADLIATYEGFILSNRAIYAVTALIVYEHFITLKHEIDFLRRPKRGAAVWIFLINRYLLLVNMLSTTVPYSSRVCGNTFLMNILYFFTGGTVPALPLHAFTVLRGLALSQNRPWKLFIMWALIILALVVVAFNIFQDFTEIWDYVVDPLLGSSCYQIGFSVPTTIIQRTSAASAAMGIALAAIVLMITLVTTVRQVLRASLLGLKATLSQILLRDGSMFFFLILFEDLVSTVAHGALLSEPAMAVMNPLLNALSSVLLSRFIINLREIDSPTASSADQQSLVLSTLNFRMPTMDEVVGNLGESLDFVEYRVEDDEDGELGVGTQSDGKPSNAERGDAHSTLGATQADVEAAYPPDSESKNGGASVIVTGRSV